ncbi:MAG: acetylornithine transaminase [Candidatus Rokubacteria bacterium GWA2_70_23]|nr:MAG: acetylornithine transaminase [Candidatus Rokubacteria bacterium GWA2_70_23]
MKVVDRPPVVMVEGRGSWLWDRDGKKYLDFVQGWAVNCLGHSPRVILDALEAQARRLINCSPAYHNEPMARLATLLADSTGLSDVFLCNSGAEANEGAIKLARKWGARHRGGAFEIVTMQHGFHGRTLATMAASGKPGWGTLFEPKVPGFPKVPLGDLEAVKKAVTPATVAVMLEPIQGEAGVIPATDDWLRDLRRLTRQLGVLMIVDEIQTGIGRTGRLFAYEHAGIDPDIVTLGKGLGGGVPIAALVAAESASCFEYGDQGGTFNGTPLMAAVGCAVVETVRDPRFLDAVAANGHYLMERLRTLSTELGHGEVRGRGLLVALELNECDAAKVARAAFDRGLLVNAPRPATLRFMPSLTVSRDEIDQMVELLRASLKHE